MRIPSGVTDQYIYFVALDATDLKTRETGLSSFTVYRSRNGAAAAAYTTPTVNETDVTNMPGVYELLLDEDMTIDSGDQSQEVCLHITKTGMAPVTRTFELYRPSVTAGETLTVASGIGQASVQSIANNAITAASIASDAITDAKVASDVTIASVTGAVGSVTGAVGSVTGAVGSVTGAVGSVTGNVGGNVTGSVGSLAAQAKADVNAEVLDVLNTDTFAEPGQGTPASTTTLVAKIGYLFKNWRNKKTQTATEWALYADDTTTKDQEAVVSDDATTATKGEISTGA